MHNGPLAKLASEKVVLNCRFTKTVFKVHGKISQLLELLA
jgi:hypothetical protein